MMTRKEAQDYALSMINKEIEENGEDSIFVKSPQPGKNTWTAGEYKYAIEHDCPLENGGKNTPIDDILEYEKWLNERGITFKN